MINSRGGRFGIFLFSSIVLVSVANLFNPFGAMLRGNKFPKIKAKSNEQQSEEGELIIKGSINFELGLWKLKGTTRQEGREEGDCELEIINELDEPVLLCWVTEDGVLKHFRPLNDRSIKDKSVSNNHLEYTRTNDHFVCIRNVEPLPSKLKDISEDAFVFSYTPLKTKLRHTLVLDKSEKKRRFFSLRGPVEAQIQVQVRYSAVESSSDIIDSSTKPYECRSIAGFRVLYEPDVFDTVAGFEATLVEDITQLATLLPSQACARLAADTAIYVNKSLTYGTLKHPVVATNCCYHPRGGADWLRKNGLGADKEGNVEIACAAEYLRARAHWGAGGVLVHEFSHVYHDKHCPEGYDCEEIRQAYNTAMKARLYDSVPVHGPQGAGGTRAKAYACTNCMEYFAELSVAYLWAVDALCEYNKWFPFNRHQLQQHDPASCAVLSTYWNQYEVGSNDAAGTGNSVVNSGGNSPAGSSKSGSRSGSNAEYPLASVGIEENNDDIEDGDDKV